MAGLPPLSEILEEYQLVEAEDRYRLLIDLGKQLDLMPDALKTDATKVRGCSASVWVYPTVDGDRLHFLDWGRAQTDRSPLPPLLLIHGLASTSWIWAPIARRLREEVSELKERIKVLERITVDKENSLAKEIESLRDR